MKGRKKVIIQSLVILLAVWALGIIIHELFLNLEYGVLRSFIVGAGVVIGRYLVLNKKSFNS